MQIAYIDEYQRKDLVSIIFSEWSSSDFDVAVEYASTLDSMSRQAAVKGIANSSRPISSDTLMKIAKRLGHEQVARDQIAMQRINYPIDDPESDWNSYLASYGTNLQYMSEVEHELLVQILRSWVVTNGADVFLEAITSLDDYDSRISMLNRLLPRLAVNQASLARAIASSMLEMDRGMLIRSIETWAEIDPSAAIEFASTFEDEATRTRMQRAAIKSWALSNPMTLLASIATLPVQVQEWGKARAIIALSSKHPELAAKEINSMPDGRIKESAIYALIHNWYGSDPDAVTYWASSDSRLSEMVETLIQTRIVAMARSDPKTALDMALEQSEDNTGVGIEALVIKQVADVDVEQAIKFLGFARNVQTRGRAYSSIGQVLIQQGETDRALQLAEKLSPEVQNQYFRWISFFWLRKDAQEMHTRMNELPPSKELQALYAQLLLREHSRNPFLSKEQTDRLETRLKENNNDSGVRHVK